MGAHITIGENMTYAALTFTDHLFRSDIIVAVQTDGEPVGSIEKRGRYFHTVLGERSDADHRWIGSFYSEITARRLLAQAWGKRFHP